MLAALLGNAPVTKDFTPVRPSTPAVGDHPHHGGRLARAPGRAPVYRSPWPPPRGRPVRRGASPSGPCGDPDHRPVALVPGDGPAHRGVDVRLPARGRRGGRHPAAGLRHGDVDLPRTRGPVDHHHDHRPAGHDHHHHGPAGHDHHHDHGTVEHDHHHVVRGGAGPRTALTPGRTRGPGCARQHEPWSGATYPLRGPGV